MRKKLAVLLILGLFLSVYQFAKNDFIEPNPSVLKTPFPEQQTELPFRVSLKSPASAKSLLLLNARNNVVMEQKRLREKHPYYYKIGIEKGDIVALDYLEKPIEDLPHCLTTELIDSLKTLLKEAQICESPDIQAPPPNVFCSANYTLPYGILSFEDSTVVNLGEKHTSCDFPTGLCGDYNTKLITWARRVLVGIKDLKCVVP